MYEKGKKILTIGGSIPRFFPGEEMAIKTVCALADIYGYGNLIHHLRNGWARHLRDQGIDSGVADMAAGHICVWCHTDSRTGKKIKKRPPH